MKKLNKKELLLSLIDNYIDTFVNMWDMNEPVGEYDNEFYEEFICDNWTDMCMKEDAFRQVFNTFGEAVYEEIKNRQTHE